MIHQQSDQEWKEVGSGRSLSGASETTTRFTPPLFTNNLDQDPLPASTIKLTIEYLLPGPEMQPPFCDCHHYFTPHDLALEMGIGIVLIPIVMILINRGMGRQFLQPEVVVAMKT